MKKRRTYTKVKDGQWVKPFHRGYKMACCDCALVHTIDFKILKLSSGDRVTFRATRDRRATANMRRGKKK